MINRLKEFFSQVFAGLVLGAIISMVFVFLGYGESYSVRTSSPWAFLVLTPLLGIWVGRDSGLNMEPIIAVVALLVGSWALSGMNGDCDLGIDGECLPIFSFWASIWIMYGIFNVGFLAGWMLRRRQPSQEN